MGLENTCLFGIPSIFYYGESNLGLRFRVYEVWKEREKIDFTKIVECLVNNKEMSVKDISEFSGFSKSSIRNWLDTLAKNDLTYKYLVEAFSGYRIEKNKVGSRVTYRAELDDSRIFIPKDKESREPLNDPMGADVPSYVINPKF